MLGRSKRRTSVVFAIGCLVGVSILLLLELITSLIPLGTRTTTLTLTMVPPTMAVELVNDSYSRHIVSFESGNASNVISQYSQNATVKWSGRAFCLNGIYVGQSYIKLFFQSFLDQTAPFPIIRNTSTAIMREDNGSVIVSSSFTFSSNGSPTYGMINGTVQAQELYAYSSTAESWLISHETWNITEFYSQYPLCGLAG